jgi:hypothetical protein
LTWIHDESGQRNKLPTERGKSEEKGGRGKRQSEKDEDEPSKVRDRDRWKPGSSCNPVEEG